MSEAMKTHSLRKGKLYKVKENVSFAIHPYDIDKCLYKPNTVHSLAHNIFGGSILMYIEDVSVSDKPGGDKIYHRPLLLIGEQLFVPRHISYCSRCITNDCVHAFNEVLEEVQEEFKQ